MGSFVLFLSFGGGGGGFCSVLSFFCLLICRSVSFCFSLLFIILLFSPLFSLLFINLLFCSFFFFSVLFINLLFCSFLFSVLLIGPFYSFSLFSQPFCPCSPCAFPLVRDCSLPVL